MSFSHLFKSFISKSKNSFKIHFDRFSVFALGSSAHRKFCSFGILIDTLLEQLGGLRLNTISFGDDLCNKEQSFNEWTMEILKSTCSKFEIDINHVPKHIFSMISSNFTEENTRIQVKDFLFEDTIEEALSNLHNKNIISCSIKTEPLNLMSNAKDFCVLVEILIDGGEFKYEPGDHIAVFPANDEKYVDQILARFQDLQDPDETVCIQIKMDDQNLWRNHPKLPTCSIRTMFLKFLNFMSPPTKSLMKFLSEFCKDHLEKNQMHMLGTDEEKYESWKSEKYPSLLDVFKEFSSCRPPVAAVIARLSPLQPRFYSISSSQLKYPDEVHLTVGVLEYPLNGQMRHGLCSNYLKNLNKSDKIYIYHQKAADFHFPKQLPLRDLSPMILVGPGRFRIE